MTAKYLLPCSCGKKLTVRARQAGEHVRCECGTELEVPTMRGLSKLSRSDDQEETQKPLWSRQQGITFLASAIAIGCAVFTIYLFLERPTITPITGRTLAEIRQDFEGYNPAQTMDYWEYLKLGLNGVEPPDQAAERAALDAAWGWINFGAALTIAAVVVAGVAAASAPKKGHRK